MSNVALTQNFQERLLEKIRADIGSLMTDEDLKKLVEATMQRTFFASDKSSLDQWGRTTEKPPKIEQLIKELMEPTLKTAMQEWLKAHPEEVTKAIDKALEGGLALASLRALDGLLQNQFQQLQFNLQSALQSALQR